MPLNQIVSLIDDSTVNKGGNAIFIGKADGTIAPNLRYSIVGIGMVDKCLMLTTIINGKQHKYSWSDWSQGTLEKTDSPKQIKSTASTTT